MTMDVFHNTIGFSRQESFIKRASGIGVEIVQGQMNMGGVWIDGIDQPAHLVSEILAGATVGDSGVSPTSEWFKAHE
jgi:hypothetical protein